MSDTGSLTPKGAIAFGSLFIASGIFLIVMAHGRIQPDDAESNRWVVAAAGLVFICGGAAVVVDYAIAGGVGPDGDFAPGAPPIVRWLNFVLGLTIVGLMTGICGWVAFGSGPRRFTTTIGLPFLHYRAQSGELMGRIAFGVSTVLLAVMFVVSGVVGVRRLLRGAGSPSASD